MPRGGPGQGTLAQLGLVCAHLVVAGRVEDVVQGAEAGHQLRVDPELGRAGQAGLASITLTWYSRFSSLCTTAWLGGTTSARGR